MAIAEQFAGLDMEFLSRRRKIVFFVQKTQELAIGYAF